MSRGDATSPIPYGSVLTQRAEADPDRLAAVFESEALSCAELERRANRWAHCFLERGVSQGDLVTIGLPNEPSFLVAAAAAWKCGAVPNPISSRLPQPECLAILELAKPALVVGFDTLEHPFPRLPGGFEPPTGTPDTPPPEATPPHERCLTSGGSTGRSKLILLKIPGLYDPVRSATILAPKGPVLVPGPLYHAAPFGALTQALLAGEKAVVMDRFDASRCLERIETHRIDQVLFVPTMLHRIARLPAEERNARDVSSLRMVLTGGAPCPPWLMRFFIDWLGPDVMHDVYGGSERLGGTHITGREWLAHPGSVGRPMAAAKIEIRDPETLEALPPGEIGEIFMLPASGQGSTYQYVGATARADASGWESTGDLGHLDAEGYLYLADRRTDLILSGGRNVYPAQVEHALEEHPAVVSSAVIGLPDEDMGQRIHALVYATEEVDDEALRAHLRERIVHYAVPRSFERVNEPLRDDSGKVRRFALREARLPEAPTR